jgi:hypothetical protein
VNHPEKEVGAGELQLWGIARHGRVKGFAVICSRHEAQKELLLVASMDATWILPYLGLHLVRVTRRDMLVALEDDAKHGRTGCCLCAGSNTRTRFLPGSTDISAADIQRDVRQA